MFIAIKKSKDCPRIGIQTWEIHDTNFVYETCWRTYCHPLAVIIQEYKRRNCNVLENLKLYYQYMSLDERHKQWHNHIIDMRFDCYSNLEFAKKYYKCLERHIKKLEWIGK